MRRTEKNRAIKRKQKQAAMAVKLNCKHLHRTPYLQDGLYGLVPYSPPKTLCTGCGEIITMLAPGVFGSSMDPKSKMNSVNTKHG